MSYEIIKHKDAGGTIEVSTGGSAYGSFAYSGLGTIEFYDARNINVTNLFDNSKYGSYYALYRFTGNRDIENISFSPIGENGITNGPTYSRDVVEAVNTQDGINHEDNVNVVRFYDQGHGSLFGITKPGYYGCGWIRMFSPSINNWKTSTQYGVGSHPDMHYFLSTGWSVQPLNEEPGGIRIGSRESGGGDSRLTGSITFYGITEGRV